MAVNDTERDAKRGTRIYALPPAGPDTASQRQFKRVVERDPGKVTDGGGGGATDSFGYPLDASDPLEALAIGTAGSGAYSGYTLALIDGFGGAASITQQLLTPDQMNGGVPGTLYNNFSERDRRRPFSAQTYCLADHAFTGWKDAGDGATLASMADLLTIQSGAIRSRHRHATAGETAVLGARTTERGPAGTTIECVTSHPTWYGRWAYIGPLIMEIRYRCVPPAGYSPTQYTTPSVITDGLNPHTTVWDCHCRGGSEAQNLDLGGGNRAGGEFDYFEMSLSGKCTARVSGLNPSPVVQAANAGAVYDGTWQVVRTTFSPSAAPTKVQQIIVRDDLATAVPGSGSVNSDYDLQGTIGDGLGNLEQPRYLMFGSLNEDQNSAYPGVLDHTKWIGKQMDSEISSVRVWMPTGNKAVSPIITPYQINQVEYAQSGTVVIDFPSVAAIWGAGTWTELCRGIQAIDVNGPGRAGGTLGDYVAPIWTSTGLPFGASVSLVSRQITLTMSDFCANWPGLCVFHIWAWDATTSVIRPYRIFVCVKPRVALPAMAFPTAGAAFSHTFPRDDGAGTRYYTSGNIPKLNAPDGGFGVAQKPAWLGVSGRTLSGTAPAKIDDTDDLVVVQAENAAGGITEQEHDAIATVRGVTGLTYVLDPRDTRTVPGAIGDKVAQAKHRYGPRALINNNTYLGRSNTAQQPVLKLGGIGGTFRVLDMNGAQFDGGASDSNPATTFQDFIDTTNISTGNKYFAIGFKLNTTTSQTIVHWSISSTARIWMLFASSGGALLFRYAGQGGSNVDLTVMATADTNWHTVEVHKVGSNLDIWLDGTKVISAHTITQTGSLDCNIFRLGGGTGASGTPQMNGDVSRLVLVSGDPTADLATIRKHVGRAHGQAL